MGDANDIQTPVDRRPFEPIVSEALLTKYEDASSLLAEIADMMDCAGLDLSDINEARSSLYEAETHLRKAEL